MTEYIPVPSQSRITAQLKHLCNDVLPRKQAALLEFLAVEAPKFWDYEQIAPQEILLRFLEHWHKDDEAKKKAVRGVDLKGNAAAARQLVGDLSRSLRLYYCELPPDADVHVLVHISEPKIANDVRYAPHFSEFRPKKKSGPLVTVIGNNVAALEYVTKALPELKAIHETFIRWIPRETIYPDEAFEKFLVELNKSRVLYRAVLGPLTDPIVYKAGGLLAALAARQFEGLPPNKKGSRVYRLMHGTACMNFTLLARFTDENDIYGQTDDIEVLFGYVVHDVHARPGEQIVFSSRDKRVWSEFYHIFQALLDRQFSRELDLDNPTADEPEKMQCDVLASWDHLPLNDMIKRLHGCTTQVRICVSALMIFGDPAFQKEIKGALKRGVQVSIALWASGAFTRLRAASIPIEEEEADQEISWARQAVRSLGKHANLSLPICTREVGSVTIFWIDDVIYFAPYWIGKDVAIGPHFMVSADSATGKEIQEQWSQMVHQ